MASAASIATVTLDYSSILSGYSAGGSGHVTDTEIANWASLIDSGTLTNTQVAAMLATSSTALNVVDPIVRLYQAAFGRTPDAAGLAGWVSQVESGNATLQQVAQAFVASSEFAARYGSSHPDAAGYVAALYQNAFGRAPESGVSAAWSQALDSGATTYAGLLLAAAQSSEAVGKEAAGIANWQVQGATTHGATIALSSSFQSTSAASIATVAQDYARALFGLGSGGSGMAGSAEIAAWASLIDSGVLSNAQVVASLANSTAATAIIDPIVRLYQAAFGRTPDLAGLQGWAAQVASGAVTLAGVAQAMVNSSEFAALYGSSDPNHPSYVQALYRTALNRGADTPGFAGWGISLDNGSLTVAQVLLGFATSAEFVAASATTIASWLAGYAASGNYTTTLGIGSNTPAPASSGGGSSDPSGPTGPLTFTLTPGTDSGAAYTGTSLNDTYNGTLWFTSGALASTSSLNASDSLNGAGGTDTVNVTIGGSNVAAGYSVAPTLTSIEKVLVTNQATDTAHPVTISLANADSSLSTIGISSSTTAGVATLFTGIDHLVAVQMAGAGDLSVAFNAAVVVGGSDSLSLSLNGVGTSSAASSTFTVNGIETLAITTAGSNFLTVVDPSLTAETIAGSGTLTEDATGLTGLRTISDSATAAVTITSATLGAAALTVTNSGSGQLTIASLFDGTTTSESFANTGSGSMIVGSVAHSGAAVATLSLSGAVAYTASGDGVTTGVTVAGGTDNANVSLTLTNGAASGSTDSITLGNGNNTVVDRSTAGTVSVSLGSGANDVTVGSATVNATATAAYTVTLASHTSTASAHDTIRVGATGATATCTINGLKAGDVLTLLADPLASSITGATAGSTLSQVEAAAAAATAYADAHSATPAHSVYILYNADFSAYDLVECSSAGLTTVVHVTGNPGLTAQSGGVITFT